MPLTKEPFGGEDWTVRYVEHLLEDGEWVDPNDVVDLLNIIRTHTQTKDEVQPSWEPGMNEEYRDIHTVPCEMCAERRAEESEDA